MRNFALALKTEFVMKFLTVFNIVFTFRMFEQLLFALKNRVCSEFTVLNMYFLSFRILNNLCLPWKQSFPWNFSLYWICIFYHSEFWATCACPEKQSVPWIHCIDYIFFIIQNFEQPALTLKNKVCPEIFHCIEIFFIFQNFWATWACPENRVCPDFFKRGGRPPPRLVRHWVNDLLRSLPNCKSFNCLCLRNRLLLIHVTFAVHPTAWLTLPNHKQHSVFDIDTGVSVQHWLNMFYFTDMGTFFAWWSHTNTLMTGRSIRFTVADSQIHILKNRSNGIFHNWT